MAAFGHLPFLDDELRAVTPWQSGDNHNPAAPTLASPTSHDLSDNGSSPHSTASRRLGIVDLISPIAKPVSPLAFTCTNVQMDPGFPNEMSHPSVVTGPNTPNYALGSPFVDRRQRPRPRMRPYPSEPESVSAPHLDSRAASAPFIQYTPDRNGSSTVVRNTSVGAPHTQPLHDTPMASVSPTNRAPIRGADFLPLFDRIGADTSNRSVAMPLAQYAAAVREATPATVVASDQGAATPHPVSPARSAYVAPPPPIIQHLDQAATKSKGAKSLAPVVVPTEEECVVLLTQGRKGKSYAFWEDFRIVCWLYDPDHPDRAEQLTTKPPKAKYPPLFDQMSTECFHGAREGAALFGRWGVIKKQFAVIERLESATGGNGVADYASDNPEQSIIEKLGERMTASRFQLEGLKAPEYYVWIKDPVNGMFATLSQHLRGDISLVRKQRFRSGAISPPPEDLARHTALSESVLDISDDSDTHSVDRQSPAWSVGREHRGLPLVILDSSSSAGDGLAGAPDTPTTPSTPSTPARRCHRRERRSTTEKSNKFSASFGADFLQQAQEYQNARTKTDQARLALERDRLEIEQGNERRAEQRLELEKERLAVMREEHQALADMARENHELEVARLELARERNNDLKRKAELDELDRLRTHKRLKAQDVTQSALTIQGDAKGGFDEGVREASRGYLMSMFQHSREE
ncbi:hypothetical protein RhiJN_22444 [Ceratobasidium sp. AG-Ba]|nr:hypothetical protein RhiJN_22444 [Ceratobasidium sp. AG-Ba]